MIAGGGTDSRGVGRDVSGLLEQAEGTQMKGHLIDAVEAFHSHALSVSVPPSAGVRHLTA